MDRHEERVDSPSDPRSMVRLNSFIELRFFIMALLYQHRAGQKYDDSN